MSRGISVGWESHCVQVDPECIGKVHHCGLSTRKGSQMNSNSAKLYASDPNPRLVSSLLFPARTFGYQQFLWCCQQMELAVPMMGYKPCSVVTALGQPTIQKRCRWYLQADQIRMRGGADYTGKKNRLSWWPADNCRLYAVVSCEKGREGPFKDTHRHRKLLKPGSQCLGRVSLQRLCG